MHNQNMQSTPPIIQFPKILIDRNKETDTLNSLLTRPVRKQCDFLHENREANRRFHWRVYLHASQNIMCGSFLAHAGNHRHASNGARHMPAGDSTTVTIICETISGNESCTACAGSGSETSKIDPISRVIQSVRFP